jgi:transcriptional regulator with XRE-family HTH domain
MATKKKSKPEKAKEDPELLELGNRIRALRVQAGYKSAEKFALDNELSRVQYNRWETGKRNISYKNLIKLTKAFKISLSEFFKKGFGN